MKPILFSENSTTFTTNGIGRLSDAISCVVMEQRNGIYELEMDYPVKGVHYADLGIRKIIVAKPAAKDTLQAFRIYQITKPIGGKVTIYAQHISYDLNKNVSMPFTITASASACANTLSGLKSNAVETCPFNFSTDVTTVSSYSQTVPSSIRSRLGGVEGSVLDQFGGEYEWDNWTVNLLRDRGTVTNITLRYGKNITDIQQDENIANTVTGVVPYWINSDKTESVTLPEKAVYSSNASRYSSRLTVPLDLSGEFKDKPTESALRAKATAYISQTGVGLPKISIKVSFVNLADTEEYKDVAPLQNVNLCDTITVQFEELGIDTTAKIVSTEYDVLSEKYNSVEVGSLRSTLASTITDMNANMASAVENVSTRIFSDTSEFVDNATAWLTSSGGYVVAVKNNDGTWKELLFMDTNDIDTAVNVLRINENGIGFSSTGVDGPYKQGWTLDGQLLIGGSNAAGLTVYKRVDNTDEILFQIDPTKIIWNATNSSMDETGTITANNAVMSGIFTSTNQNLKVEMGAGELCFYNGSTMMFDIYISSFYQYSPVIRATQGLRIQASKALDIWGSEGVNIEGDKDFKVQVAKDINLNVPGKARVWLDESSRQVDIWADNSIYIEADEIELNAGNLKSGTIEDVNGDHFEFTNGLLTRVY